MVHTITIGLQRVKESASVMTTSHLKTTVEDSRETLCKALNIPFRQLTVPSVIKNSFTLMKMILSFIMLRYVERF